MIIVLRHRYVEPRRSNCGLTGRSAKNGNNRSERTEEPLGDAISGPLSSASSVAPPPAENTKSMAKRCGRIWHPVMRQ